MSWDISLIRTKTNTEPYGEIVDENIIGFTKNEIRNEIMILADEFGLYTEDLDTSYMHLRGKGWSIEFCFWEDYKLYDIVELQVRGVNEPTDIFARLKKDFNARIYDMHGKKFIEDNSKSGFSAWVEFTDEIIKDLKKQQKANDGDVCS